MISSSLFSLFCESGYVVVDQSDDIDDVEDKLLFVLSDLSSSGISTILDGEGDRDLDPFALGCEGFSTGVPGCDEVVVLSLSLDFFLDLTRAFCFDCRSEI